MSNKFITTTMLAVFMTSSVATMAGAAFSGQTITSGGSKFKATKVQLAIKNPITNACPTKAKMSIWIFANKPGTVSYMIAKKGGGVSGPFNMKAKKGANGVTMASSTRNIQIDKPVNSQYRILVSGTNGKVLSNWVTMKASCKIKLGG